MHKSLASWFLCKNWLKKWKYNRSWKKSALIILRYYGLPIRKLRFPMVCSQLASTNVSGRSSKAGGRHVSLTRPFQWAGTDKCNSARSALTDKTFGVCWARKLGWIVITSIGMNCSSAPREVLCNMPSRATSCVLLDNPDTQWAAVISQFWSIMVAAQINVPLW